MKLIVGLGNPGKKYETQRHNLGFMVIDRLAEEYAISLNLTKCKALYGKGNIEGETTLLVKPQTYMNLSGESVVCLKQFYKVELEDILVLSDDLNIDFSRIRIRKSGSDGGHNGLKSITQCLGGNNYARMRLGIGLPREGSDVSNYVLSQFRKDEMDALNDFIEQAKNAVVTIIAHSIDKGMNEYSS
ncbi:MAG: aminoacyl-tRNA hydrolase [Spirochaetota bacterium]|nr:aminoacyl-tRNA hydrolase [Spirochaetota bacterium]